MFRRIIVALSTLLAAGSLLAQEQTSAEELARKVRELEAKIAAIQATQPSSELSDIKNQIDALSKEIEGLKTRQEDDKAPAADTEQFGLGAAASKVYRVDHGLSFGGYGEMLYENYAAETDAGARVTTKDRFDMLRGVLYAGYKYNDRILLNTEFEFEHGNTGQGGEASVEFAYLDFLVTKDIGIRTGLVLIPMGLVNERHEPTTYLASRRSQVENAIIPTTWREMGAGVFGENGPFSWRVYAVNSIRGDKFTASGLRGGRQKGYFSQIEDIALTGRLDYEPMVGTTVGASFFNGNTGQGSMVGSDRVDAKLSMFDLHAETMFRGVTARALYARATLDEAAKLNTLNALTGNRGVGESLGGWYVEAGYDLATLRPFGEASLTPYARYERLDTQRRVPAGFTRNPASDQTIFTYGIQLKPIPQVVIKADYQNIDNEAGTGTDQWNLGIGYIF